MYNSMFQLTFSEGDNFCNFLYASMDNITILNWDLLIKKKQNKIAQFKGKLFPLRLGMTEKVGKPKWQN